MTDALSSLLGSLRAIVPAPLRQQMVIFGSAGIVLAGVDLGRPVHDLDLYVSPETYAAVRPLGDEVEILPGVMVIKLTPLIEVLTSFPGTVFADVWARSRPLPPLDDVRLGALADIAMWKRVQSAQRPDAAARDKDLRDLARIAASGLLS